MDVGESVVGARVGGGVGDRDGRAVGPGDGDSVGGPIGDPVGSGDGEVVVGLRVGPNVGAVVVGYQVGALEVGFNVGTAVGAGVSRQQLQPQTSRISKLFSHMYRADRNSLPLKMIAHWFSISSRVTSQQVGDRVGETVGADVGPDVVGECVHCRSPPPQTQHAVIAGGPFDSSVQRSPTPLTTLCAHCSGTMQTPVFSSRAMLFPHSKQRPVYSGAVPFADEV